MKWIPRDLNAEADCLSRIVVFDDNNIWITSWLVSAYDFYSRVVKDRVNERVSEANE